MCTYFECKFELTAILQIQFRALDPCVGFTLTHRTHYYARSNFEFEIMMRTIPRAFNPSLYRIHSSNIVWCKETPLGSWLLGNRKHPLRGADTIRVRKKAGQKQWSRSLLRPRWNHPRIWLDRDEAMMRLFIWRSYAIPIAHLFPSASTAILPC